MSFFMGKCQFQAINIFLSLRLIIVWTVKCSVCCHWGVNNGICLNNLNSFHSEIYIIQSCIWDRSIEGGNFKLRLSLNFLLFARFLDHILCIRILPTPESTSRNCRGSVSIFTIHFPDTSLIFLV